MFGSQLDLMIWEQQLGKGRPTVSVMLALHAGFEFETVLPFRRREPSVTEQPVHHRSDPLKCAKHVISLCNASYDARTPDSHDSDLVPVASEFVDVLLDPSVRRALVQESCIAMFAFIE